MATVSAAPRAFHLVQILCPTCAAPIYAASEDAGPWFCANPACRAGGYLRPELEVTGTIEEELHTPLLATVALAGGGARPVAQVPAEIMQALGLPADDPPANAVEQIRRLRASRTGAA